MANNVINILNRKVSESSTVHSNAQCECAIMYILNQCLCYSRQVYYVFIHYTTLKCHTSNDLTIIVSDIEFPREVQLVTEDPSVIEGGREMERVAVRRLMRVASHLVEMGVRFVSCQKVIHPLLKDYWREKVW